MTYTFSGCRNLIGDLVINATNLKAYKDCLTNVSTNVGTMLNLNGYCSGLENVLATKSSNNNI